MNSTVSRFTQSTVVRCACSCHTSISGRARNGFGASRSRTRSSRGSGNRTDTTCGATPGASSATGATEIPLMWQLGEVAELIQETPRVASLVLKVPDWPGHDAGQHVDLRVTAEDGYQAQRSYSIASPPEDSRLAITVERLEDGEVSPYLVGEVKVGDKVELRGPIGGYFVWRADDERPL